MEGRTYKRGLKDGIPIALGYFSVSMGFGVFAVNKGLKIIETILISMTNLTSAGQVAGVEVIAAVITLCLTGAIELILTEFTINLRYSLMGISLSQKLDPNFRSYHRFFTSFFLTDEIFAVASSRIGKITSRYLYGLSTLPYVGWTLGTIIGAIASNFLPLIVSAALGIAIYGMFIAIIVPPMKNNFGIVLAIIISACLSIIIKYVPIFSFISFGFSIIICAIVGSIVASIVRPIDEN